MIFKQGDFVRINNTVAGNHHKEHLIGKIFKVKGESKVKKHAPTPVGSRTYRCNAYVLEGDPHYFYATELDMVAFPKEALENGMVVEYRDGSQRMVHNKDLLIGDIKYSKLDDYWSDLTHTDDEAKDIVKVFKSSAHSFSEMWKDHTLELIWDRNRVEPKEMTLDELETILGYRVNIIK